MSLLGKATDYFITYYFNHDIFYKISLLGIYIVFNIFARQISNLRPTTTTTYAHSLAYAPFKINTTCNVCKFLHIKSFYFFPLLKKKLDATTIEQLGIKKKKITFDNNKQIEDAIACKTSRAEQIASFTFWTSACRNKRTK
jgi:hypothetical protein